MNLDTVGKLQQRLETDAVDAVIAISPENFAYLAGFIVPSQPILRWRHAAVVLTRDGRTGVLAVDMEATTVRDREPEADVRVWREFEDDAMPVLSDLLRDLGLASSTVAIETAYLPARDMERLRELLPDVSWRTADRMFDDARMIKTPREIEIIRRASRITDTAILRALESVRPGDNELDLAAAVTSGLYRLGAERYELLIVATGPRSRLPNVGPTNRVLERGDVIRLEVFGIVDGYHAGVCRSAVVEATPPEVERVWHNFVSCRDMLLDRIRDGASSAHVYRDFLEIFSELGYDPISFVAHGIGLFLHEEPYVGRTGDPTLATGMTLGVEPLVYGPDFGLQMKDVVLVGPDGAERLSDVTDTDELVVVS
jgi:Xaa-Pro aminopeptidase